MVVDSISLKLVKSFANKFLFEPKTLMPEVSSGEMTVIKISAYYQSNKIHYHSAIPLLGQHTLTFVL